MLCRKSIAIEEEDYDTAKAIKGEISKIRAGGTVPAAADEIVIRADATAQGAAALDSSPLAADAFQSKLLLFIVAFDPQLAFSAGV